jgi:hypothetical protein
MEEGAHAAESLRALPAGEREPWLAQHPEALCYHTFVDLIRGVAHAIGRDPRDAVALSELIVRHIDQVPIPLIYKSYRWHSTSTPGRNAGTRSATWASSPKRG